MRLVEGACGPGATGDPKPPRPKERRILQPGQLPVNLKQNLLQHIVCVRRTDETNQIPAEGRLNPAEHQLERVSVAALGPQDPHRFLL